MNKKAKSLGGAGIQKIVVFLVSVGILAVCWRLGLKWVAGGVILALIVYLFVLPRIAASRLEKFNRKAMGLLTSGKHDELKKLASRSYLLQLFGPRGAIEAKLGLAHAASHEFLKAIPLFELAIPEARASESLPLRIGLAKSLFVTGDFKRARKEGTAVLDSGTRLPELMAVVARSRVGLGQLDDETNSLLDEAERLSPDDDVSLMLELTRIEIALKRGRSPGNLRNSADSSAKFLRSWIALVRGLLREKRGDKNAATKSFKQSIKTDDRSFPAAEARKHIEEVNTAIDNGVKSSPEMDSAIRRKKKRKR
jgi:tetratricopeptide (TPR) repeat protein